MSRDCEPDAASGPQVRSMHDDDELIVVGNPHTYPGRLAVKSTDCAEVWNIGVLDAVASDAYSQGWLSGYLAGSEPPPSFDDFPESRIKREVEFFRSRGRVLPRCYSGAVALNATVCTAVGAGLREISDGLFMLFQGLRRSSARFSSFEWLPLIGENTALDSLPVDSGTDFYSLFEALNSGAVFSGVTDFPIIVHLVSLGDEEDDPIGAIEIFVSAQLRDGLEGRVELTINFERERSCVDTPYLDVGGLSTLFEAVVDAVGPEVASMGPGVVQAEGDGFYITYADDDPLFGSPGWLTYVRGAPVLQNLPEGCQARIFKDGVLIELTAGLDGMSLEDLNALAGVLCSRDSGNW